MNTKIPLEPVASSYVKALGYDEATETLLVEFRSDARYAYHKVPKHVYEALTTAPSIGSYFAGHVKAHYAFERLAAPKPDAPAADPGTAADVRALRDAADTIERIRTGRAGRAMDWQIADELLRAGQHVRAAAHYLEAFDHATDEPA